MIIKKYGKWKTVILYVYVAVMEKLVVFDEIDMHFITFLELLNIIPRFTERRKSNFCEVGFN